MIIFRRDEFLDMWIMGDSLAETYKKASFELNQYTRTTARQGAVVNDIFAHQWILDL